MADLTVRDIIAWLAEVFDAPCNYGFGGVDVTDVMPYEFCENCSDDYKECWKVYLERVCENG